MGDLEKKLLDAFRSHSKGHVDKHLANISVLIKNPAGIGEHGDVIAEIEKEMMEVAKYDDMLSMLDKYFPQITLND